MLRNVFTEVTDKIYIKKEGEIMKKQLIAVVSALAMTFTSLPCEHCGGNCAETRFTVHV